MEACYDSPNFPAESFCNLITRNASGQVTGISTGYQNVGQVEFSGLLSTVNYAMDLGEYGTLNLNANYTYTDNHTITTGGGNPNRNDGEIGESKHRATVSATWMNGRWTVFNQVRWLSDAVFDNLDDATSKDILGVDDWYVFDTSVAYELNDSTSIQFNVDNLFNEAPPYPAVASGAGITAYFPGILERYTTVTLRTRF
jgi:outer membrane receptor protein involved in Fe transport